MRRWCRNGFRQSGNQLGWRRCPRTPRRWHCWIWDARGYQTQLLSSDWRLPPRGSLWRRRRRRRTVTNTNSDRRQGERCLCRLRVGLNLKVKSFTFSFTEINAFPEFLYFPLHWLSICSLKNSHWSVAQYLAVQSVQFYSLARGKCGTILVAAFVLWRLDRILLCPDLQGSFPHHNTMNTMLNRIFLFLVVFLAGL